MQGLKARSIESSCFSGKGVATMITEMERGFAGHCPFGSLSDLYASAYECYHAGKVCEAFDQFGRIEAASSMFAESDVDVLIARRVRGCAGAGRGYPSPGPQSR
jgi:hypothetical protein